MALITIGAGTLPSQTVSANPSSLLIDASGEEVAFIVRAPKTGAIRKFYFRLGVVTTGETLRGSLQNVNVSTGDPDGTADQSGTIIVSDANDNAWRWITLDSNRDVTRGELLAIVIGFDSAVGNLNIICGGSSIFNNVYCSLKTGGSWTKQARSPLVAIEYSDGSFDMMPGCNAAIGTGVDFGSSSSPNEAGNRLILAVPMALRGVSFLGRLNANTDIVVYDSSSNVLGTTLLDGPVKVTNDANYYAMFDDIVLLPGTYRIALKPTSASTIRRMELSYPSNDAIAQDEFGTAFCKTARTGGGSWTDDTAARIAMQLYASKINDASVPSGFKGVTL